MFFMTHLCFVKIKKETYFDGVRMNTIIQNTKTYFPKKLCGVAVI